MKNPNEIPDSPSGAEKEFSEMPIVGELDGSLRNETREALKRTDRINQAAKTIAEKHPERREQTTTLRERARKLGRQIAKTAEYTALLTSLVLAADITDHKLTRYTVDEKTDDHGGLIFHHQDRETTDILNYLTGEGDLPKKDKLTFEVMWIQRVARNTGLAVPHGLENMSGVQLSNAWDTLSHEIYRKYGLRDNYRDGELDRVVPSRYEHSENLYQTLWAIEEVAGNPEIRFEDFSKADPLSVMLRTNIDRASYDPVTNTMYIPYPELGYGARESDRDELVENFVSEASHGKQWEEKPLSHDLQGIRDGVFVLTNALRNRKPLNETYKDTLYDKPGTVEYEAHHEIEPKLVKELDDYKKEEEENRIRKGRYPSGPEGGASPDYP